MTKLNWDKARNEKIVERSDKRQREDNYKISLEMKKMKSPKRKTTSSYDKKVYEPKLLKLLEQDHTQRTRNALKIILRKIRKGYMSNADREIIKDMLNGRDVSYELSWVRYNG